jgi:hypothetical protein
MGMDVSDQDYADSFGAPQELVGTPAINDWMLDSVEKQNVQQYQMDGDTLNKATAKAAETRAGVQKTIDELMAKKGML